MPDYGELDTSTEAGTRTIERLLALRAGLREHVPLRTLKEHLLLATWNIRDFDKPAYGPRLEEANYYIAEIISHFDLVAIQEVYKDLTALKRVMEILGSHWKCMFTDETAGKPGNDERLAFVFDDRKVDFGGLASELVLPPLEHGGGVYEPVPQIWRTPFTVGFRSGWHRFMLTTVHITWGDDTANPASRVEEIRRVAQFLKSRSEDETSWARNLILLGDFNIFRTHHETFQQLTNAGFVVPPELLEARSNAARNKHFDQIAFKVREGSLVPTGKAGAFDYYDYVFRNTEDDRDLYVEFMETTTQSGDSTPYTERTEDSKTRYYKTYWRTHQMSDHLPLWVELKVDHSDAYLASKLE